MAQHLGTAALRCTCQQQSTAASPLQSWLPASLHPQSHQYPSVPAAQRQQQQQQLEIEELHLPETHHGTLLHAPPATAASFTPLPVSTGSSVKGGGGGEGSSSTSSSVSLRPKVGARRMHIWSHVCVYIVCVHALCVSVQPLEYRQSAVRVHTPVGSPPSFWSLLQMLVARTTMYPHKHTQTCMHTQTGLHTITRTHMRCLQSTRRGAVHSQAGIAIPYDLESGLMACAADSAHHTQQHPTASMQQQQQQQQQQPQGVAGAAGAFEQPSAGAVTWLLGAADADVEGGGAVQLDNGAKPPMLPLVMWPPMRAAAAKYAAVRTAANVLDRAWLISNQVARVAPPSLRVGLASYLLVLHALSWMEIAGTWHHCP